MLCNEVYLFMYSNICLGRRSDNSVGSLRSRANSLIMNAQSGRIGTSLRSLPASRRYCECCSAINGYSESVVGDVNRCCTKCVVQIGNPLFANADTEYASDGHTFPLVNPRGVQHM